MRGIIQTQGINFKRTDKEIHRKSSQILHTKDINQYKERIENLLLDFTIALLHSKDATGNLLLSL